MCICDFTKTDEDSYKKFIEDTLDDEVIDVKIRIDKEVIGYWGYREYITKYPETNTDKLSPLKNSNEARSRNPFVQCPEGTIWYEYMQNKNFLGRKDNAERNRHV